MMHFDISAQIDAQAVPRVIEHFALRTLVPDRVIVERTGATLRIRIAQDGLEEALARLISEKLRASVLIEAVTLSAGRSGDGEEEA